MTVIAICILLAPIVAGWIGMRAAHNSGRKAASFVLGSGLLVFAVWFALRVDERHLEGIIAGLGAALCAFGLWRIRRDDTTVELDGLTWRTTVSYSYEEEPPGPTDA